MKFSLNFFAGYPKLRLHSTLTITKHALWKRRGRCYKSRAVDSAICPLNSSCDNKHNAVSVCHDRVCGGYFYEVNVGRVQRFGAAVLVHMLYTVQFCAKQNLSKVCTRLGLLSAQDIFAQLIQPALFLCRTYRRVSFADRSAIYQCPLYRNTTDSQGTFAFCVNVFVSSPNS